MQFGPDYRSDLDLILANRDGSALMPNSVSATVSRLLFCVYIGVYKMNERPRCEEPVGLIKEFHNGVSDAGYGWVLGEFGTKST